LVLLATFLSVFADAYQDAETKLIDPNPLFNHAKDYQTHIANLQLDINVAIADAQDVVSSLLKTSSTETLRQYENHFTAIENQYGPHVEDFNKLEPGDCKESAYSILSNIIIFTGYEASNCHKSYDNSVTEIIAGTTTALVDFDGDFKDLLSTVVKAFVGKNLFISPDEIKDRISNSYAIALERWNNLKPQFDDLRRNLAIGIGGQNILLGQCHDTILEEAIRQTPYFERAIKTCKDFTPAQKAFGKTAEPWVQIVKEFQEQLEQFKPFEWKN